MEVGHTGPTGPEVTEARSRPEPEPVANLTQHVEEDTAVDPPNKPDVSLTSLYLTVLYIIYINKKNSVQRSRTSG